MTRAQVEQVMDRYLGVLNDKPIDRTVIRRLMVDDLLALAPEPSREALPAIFGDHVGTVELSDQLYDKLLAWARGEETRQAWCAHLTDIGNHRWFFMGLNGKPTYEWDKPVCPLCHIPRPQP